MKFIFARVPTYDTFTGDRRVWTKVQRRDFVCFVIDLDTMRGCGFRADTLPAVKEAADHFTQHFAFPDGSKP